ncbi:hypothetical protein IL992_06810 [Microbispora sp. NEAU-D428]|uniref:hypothetical protein n=1 Tax=Microbispora sitophila TaxID=2771537 RepID=UPI001867D2E7|nr:hypothetical protein [Microbispora sitophila]MBE3008898.1 hypothetical protein [Microbispora sitophila]
MTLLVHLTPAKNIRSIRRAGIRATSLGRNNVTGVYCLPVLPSYQITYQWGRELRRSGQRTLVAVHFRIPDDEPVWAGHYNAPPVQLGSAAAAALIAEQQDARGYELLLPRPIQAGEIHRIRGVNQVTGWRYMPDAHGRPPCGCPICTPRGGYGAAKIRKAYMDE